MNVEVKEIGACRQSVKVEVPAEKVDAVYDEAYKMLRGSVQIKGFRQGHAPRKLLERKFGDEIANDVRSRLFQESFMDALKENNLSPMGDPDMDIETLVVEPGKPFSYQTEVDVRPTFDLPAYEGIKVTEKINPVTDDDINGMIDNLRKNFAEYNPVDAPAKENDQLEVDVNTTVEGEELFKQEDQRCEVSGDRLFGLECADLVKELSGLKAGDTKTVEITLPDDFFKEDMRGKTAKVEMTVKQVLAGELPEADEGFAKRLGMPDLEGLRNQIKSNISMERERESRQQLEEEIGNKLVEMTPFDLPEEFMKRQNEAALMRSKMQLARMGATKEYLAEQEEELKKTSLEETDKNVRRAIIFDAIADKEEIEIGQAELQQQIEMLARSYQTTPAKMLKRIQDNNGLAAMASELRDIKTMQLLIEKADITKEEIKEE